MPCDSSHCEATDLEVEGSLVCCVLDELAGRPTTRDADYEGYHPSAYGKVTRERLDAWTQVACAALGRMMPSAVQALSLETQLWWRKHQEADRRKAAASAQHIKDKAERAAALGKLSRRERKLLGIKVDPT